MTEPTTASSIAGLIVGLVLLLPTVLILWGVAILCLKMIWEDLHGR